MSQYDAIDAAILETMDSLVHPLYRQRVRDEAWRIAAGTARDEARIIDGRLTALKKAGRITFNRRIARWVLT